MQKNIIKYMYFFSPTTCEMPPTTPVNTKPFGSQTLVASTPHGCRVPSYVCHYFGGHTAGLSSCAEALRRRFGCRMVLGLPGDVGCISYVVGLPSPTGVTFSV